MGEFEYLTVMCGRLKKDKLVTAVLSEDLKRYDFNSLTHLHTFSLTNSYQQNIGVFEHMTSTLQELRMLSTVTLYCQVTKIVMIQVLNCQNCNQCLKCHKSPELSCERPLPHTIHNAEVGRSFGVRSNLFITLIKCHF